VVYPKLHYNTSTCAGLKSHNNDPSVLQTCGAISEDALIYYDAMLAIADYWVLYQSGAIDTCALELGLFDPSMNLTSFGNSEMLIVGFIGLILG